MALGNITADMDMLQSSSQAAENIILCRKEFFSTLTPEQQLVFRLQLENAFEIGWVCREEHRQYRVANIL